MKIAPDSLLFIFADLNNLFFESLGMLEQSNARLGCLVLFFRCNSCRGDQEEKGKTDRNLRGLNSSTQIHVPQCDVGPRPERPC